MIFNLRIGLPLVGLLMAILALEWLAPPPAAPAPAPRAAAVRGITAATPTRHQHDMLARYVTSILARPLFARDRRPAGPQRSSRASKSRGLPRLAGIVIAASRRRAIFEDAGKPIVRGAGGVLDGYRIISINSRSVMLRGPAGATTVGVSFDDNRTVPQPFVYRMAPTQPGILDRLNMQAPPSFPLPRPPNIQAMLARQRQAQQ